MCGRYTLTAETEMIAEFLGFPLRHSHIPRYNIAPSQKILTLTAPNPEGVREMIWGIEASWSKSGRIINARSESALEKPSFRKLLRSYRCLILADGFFEWQKLGSNKQPHFIYLAEREIFGFAGFYDPRTLQACILTGEATKELSSLHHRMPLILRKPLFKAWLQENELDAESFQALQSKTEKRLHHYPVASTVNSPKNDTPQNVESL